jgi:hypothetical protein
MNNDVFVKARPLSRPTKSFILVICDTSGDIYLRLIKFLYLHTLLVRVTVVIMVPLVRLRSIALLDYGSQHLALCLLPTITTTELEELLPVSLPRSLVLGVLTIALMFFLAIADPQLQLL